MLRGAEHERHVGTFSFTSDWPVSKRPQRKPEGPPTQAKGAARRDRSAFEIVFEKRVTVTQGGVDQELSVEEALQLRTYQDALAGNRAAQRAILKMIVKREKAIADRTANTRTMPLITSKMENRTQETPTPPCVFSASPPPTKQRGA